MAGIPAKGGLKGRSGPPGNMNAFKQSQGKAETPTITAAIRKNREEDSWVRRS
jgi:hypothetical protein